MFLEEQAQHNEGAGGVVPGDPSVDGGWKRFSMAGRVEAEHEGMGLGAEGGQEAFETSLDGPDVAEGEPRSEERHDLLVGPLGVAVDECEGVGVEVAAVEGLIKLVEFVL